MQKPAATLFLFFLWICLAVSAPAFAMSVSYDDFSDLSDFSLNGSTGAINSGGPVHYGGQDVLRLTDNLSQGGSAFLTESINLTDDSSFSAFFSFQITDPQGMSDHDGQGADGLTFTVQTLSDTAGGMGGGIGYKGIGNSIAVEYDTWNNGSIDDHSGNHVGIDTNGSVNSVVQTSVNPRLNNGDVWYSWVDYNGADNLLEVRLSTTNKRPSDALLDYTIDLTTTLGTDDVYVGFTSGTGGAGGDHDIRSFEFNNTYAPIGGGGTAPVPEPSTMILLGCGLVGLVGFGRKKITK